MVVRNAHPPLHTNHRQETSRARDVLDSVHLLLPLHNSGFLGRDNILDLGHKHFFVAQDSCVTGTFARRNRLIDIHRVALCGSCQYIMFMDGVNLDLPSARGEAQAER
jgi:hypothetical protein